MLTNDTPRNSRKAACLNAGMTQPEAADALGVNVATLQNYESKETVLDWNLVSEIGEV